MKAHWSEVEAQVRNGETFEVVNRGRPTVRIIPAAPRPHSGLGRPPRHGHSRSRALRRGNRSRRPGGTLVNHALSGHQRPAQTLHPRTRIGSGPSPRRVPGSSPAHLGNPEGRAGQRAPLEGCSGTKSPSNPSRNPDRICFKTGCKRGLYAFPEIDRNSLMKCVPPP